MATHSGPLTVDVIRKTVKKILKNADLSSLSSKKVRKIMEEKFQADLTHQKQQIDDILMALINCDESTEDKNADRKKQDKEDHNSEGMSGTGHSSYSESEESSAENGLNDDKQLSSSKGLKRKRSYENGGSTKKSNKRNPDASEEENAGKSKSSEHVSDSSDEDEAKDEALARKLQQEELGVRPRSSKKVERKPKKYASTEKTPRKKGVSIYSQECVLSEELASVMGTNRMARKDVVSRMWQIFKERNLMDPKKRQYVICDEQLERVFKTKKFKAFGMMKILKHHIKDPKLVQS